MAASFAPLLFITSSGSRFMPYMDSQFVYGSLYLSTVS